MKVLFVYTGEPLPAWQGDLEATLQSLPTTHTSEVNSPILLHLLQERGHELVFLGKDDPPPKRCDFDVLFLYKIHGLKLAVRKQLFGWAWLPGCQWKKVVAWLDAPRPQLILGDSVKYLERVAWGTPELLQESSLLPRGGQGVIEHATQFLRPPVLSPAQPRGLFAGRLPAAYLCDLLVAAEVVPMRTYALWIEWNGRKCRLRPSQLRGETLGSLRQSLPASIELLPGSNLQNEALQASACSFGLCPSASPGQPQSLSASKFYDYLALGLPVVLAENVPEARFVRDQPWLGELYNPTRPESLRKAIGQVMEWAREHDFLQRRRRIQEWVFAHHTYWERAEQMDRFLLARPAT